MIKSFRPGSSDVFLVIDVQNDFCSGGNLAVPDGEAVVPVINRLAEAFEHVVLAQDWHPASHGSFASTHPGKAPFETVSMPYGEQVLWPDHCVQETTGARFHEDLDIPHAEMIIRKGYRKAIDSYSAFFENDHSTPTGLEGYLRERGLNRVVVAGLALDYCVRYSAEDALKRGFEVFLFEDACRAIDSVAGAKNTRDALTKAGAVVLMSEEAAI